MNPRDDKLSRVGQKIGRPSHLPDRVGLQDKPVAETDLVSFRRSQIHEIGGFAKTHIAKGARVLEYLGEKIDKRESLRRCELQNTMIFALDAQHDLDGNVNWNPARFINHACFPNCDAVLEQGRIWIIARRDIVAGEELTFNYGYDLTDHREYPCSCGSQDCVGYIVAEEFFDHVRAQNALSAEHTHSGAR